MPPTPTSGRTSVNGDVGAPMNNGEAPQQRQHHYSHQQQPNHPGGGRNNEANHRAANSRPSNYRTNNHSSSTAENMRSSSTTRTETTNGSNNNHHGSKPDGILNTNALLNAPPRGNGELVQPTPMFERLVTEEVQELKTYVRIVENQNRRLADLERVQRDLEGRLEAETVGRQQLESTLEAREREWAERLEHVEGDRDQWKRQVDVEKTKNSKLIDQVVRKDQDIHRMLQRKYDHETTRSNRGGEAGRSTRGNEATRSIRGTGRPIDNEASRSVRPSRPIASERRGFIASASNSKSPEVRNDGTHKGPHQVLAAAGNAEKDRHRKANSLLFQFFGM